MTNAGGLTSPSISVIAGDTTAPDAPTNLAVSDDGLVLSGKGEPGSTVTIKDPAGNVIGTGAVSADGTFSITLETAQTNGETLGVTLTDKAGNRVDVAQLLRQAGRDALEQLVTHWMAEGDSSIWCALIR